MPSLCYAIATIIIIIIIIVVAVVAINSIGAISLVCYCQSRKTRLPRRSSPSTAGFVLKELLAPIDMVSLIT